jgi:hypothetical protein
MRLWDVNILVYAFRSDSPLHAAARGVLLESVDRHEPFLFSPPVAIFFLRLVTNPRIFLNPSGLAESWRFIDLLESHPSALHVESDAMTFGIFKHLCLVSEATGNDIPDAWLAATAIRHDAVLVTADRGFSRWGGLQVEWIG